MHDLKKQLSVNSEASNLLSFFGLTAEGAKENVLVVDRGFDGATEEFMTFMAPKGMAKSKKSGKTQIAKQRNQMSTEQ